MKVEALELANFRSYESGKFALHPDVTLVVGPNASGKTNLLESLYVLASTKSFRAHDRDLIRHGQDHFRVVVSAEETEYALGVSVGTGALEKRITHDGVKRTLVSHVGQLQVTLFEPTDLELVSGPPEARRRYLDYVLCQTDRGYLKTLQQYKRVLRQRNALLSQDDTTQIREQLFGWDIKLAELALEVHDRRQELISTLNSTLPHLYQDIAGQSVELVMDYSPSIKGVYAEQFLETLTRNLGRDLAAGFTTIGPHREDFKLRFRNNDIMSVASRGEIRTTVLALKLAELAYAERVTGIRPLLLLDDVFSELDRSRRDFLVKRLKGYQAVITTTDADSIKPELSGHYSLISTEENTSATR